MLTHDLNKMGVMVWAHSCDRWGRSGLGLGFPPVGTQRVRGRDEKDEESYAKGFIEFSIGMFPREVDLARASA